MRVYAFVDHSNINITAQKAAGRKLLFPEGIDDPCVRLSPAKTFDFLQNFHAGTSNGGSPAELEVLFWYTSDPSVLQQENIGGRKVTGRCFKKGTWTTREKCVDTYFVADAVEVILEQSQNLPECECPGIISVWTGDKDILQPIIDKAVKYKWKVEIWSFDNSRSAVAGNAGDNVDIISRSLDSEYEHIVERRTGWKPNSEKRPPEESSLKLQFTLGSEELNLVRDKGWRDLVEHMTRRACLPMQHWFAWDEGVLHLILAMMPKQARIHMNNIREKRVELQAAVHSFMDLQYKIRSDCTLSIEPPKERKDRPKIPTGSHSLSSNSNPYKWGGVAGSSTIMKTGLFEYQEVKPGDTIRSHSHSHGGKKGQGGRGGHGSIKPRIGNGHGGPRNDGTPSPSALFVAGDHGPRIYNHGVRQSGRGRGGGGGKQFHQPRVGNGNGNPNLPNANNNNQPQSQSQPEPQQDPPTATLIVL